MENNADGALQQMQQDGDGERMERVVPFLLFFLLLGAAYLGAVRYGGQTLAWFILLVLLSGGFLFAYLQISRELRKSRENEAKREAELNAATERVARREEYLHEIAESLDKTRAQLNGAHSELVQVNQLYENLSLQLEITESELKALKSESEAILANVKQGVFLINADGTIGGQYSEELKNIFQIPDAESRNFMRLLRPLVPEKHHLTISSYIQLLFNPKKNAQQLHRFNPLKRVELNFQSPEGGFAPKCVEFSFQRVLSDERIARVLVTAVDVTERMQMESKLREGEERREKQLELLCDLLNADNTQLRSFLKEAEMVIASVNATFRANADQTTQTESIQDKVNQVFRMVHKLKSQATAVGLKLIEREVHQLEDLLNDLRRNSRASNEDLLNVLVRISGFQARLKEAGELIEKVASLCGGGVSATRGAADRLVHNTPTAELMASTEELCRTVAARTGKKARIEWGVTGFDELPLTHQTALRDAIFQLVRNSVTHGIEVPEKREEREKDPCGLIALTIKPVPECHAIHLTCRDDGNGLDVEAIRNRAVRDGMLQPDAAQTLPENEVYTMIFEPGFSTATAVSEDAGRGVGLDALHETITGQLKGEIQMEFGAGRYCQFELLIPVA